jgi:hypothetical protein
MKAIVFLGPSLPLANARRIVAAEYRPPARCGDLLSAIRDGAGTIGLIDRHPDFRPALLRKELDWARAEGVFVLHALCPENLSADPAEGAAILADPGPHRALPLLHRLQARIRVVGSPPPPPLATRPT